MDAAGGGIAGQSGPASNQERGVMDQPETMDRDAASPQPNERLEQVFASDAESEAMVVHGLLESNGIETMVSPLEAPQDILPGVGGIVLRVRAEDAEEAREIIKAYRTEPGEESDDAEPTDDSAA